MAQSAPIEFDAQELERIQDLSQEGPSVIEKVDVAGESNGSARP